MVSPLGETDLTALLASMQPQLQPAVFVFSSLPKDYRLPNDVHPLCQFQEDEGLALILPQATAERAQLPYQYPCRQITLTVHSSLAAVGLLATIAQALAAAGISANVVSAYYHDHIFVPCDRATAAMTCLHQLAEQAQAALHNPDNLPKA